MSATVGFPHPHSIARLPRIGDYFFRCARESCALAAAWWSYFRVEVMRCSGVEPLFNCANAVLEDLVNERVISEDDRKRMVLGVYARHREELLEPFNAGARFQSLSVEHCELFDLPDAAWTDYQADGNVLVLVRRHAAFFRAVFVPSLASAISDPGKHQAFADCLEQKLTQRLCERPTPFHSFVQVMVLSKQGPAANSSAGSAA